VPMFPLPMCRNADSIPRRSPHAICVANTKTRYNFPVGVPPPMLRLATAFISMLRSTGVFLLSTNVELAGKDVWNEAA